MEKYDYYKDVKNAVVDYIENEINLSEWKGRKEELEEKLNEDLWTCDSVTGNGSGSYTFNTWEAEENIYHNFDLLAEALEEFGSDENPLEKGAEWCDVTIRCYLLPQAIAAALDEFSEDLEEEAEDKERTMENKLKFATNADINGNVYTIVADLQERK